MNIYFTSDTHFGHKNILGYCGRPFKNVWEMNAKLIDNWNDVVGPRDTVYHLGDFAFLPERQTKEIIECLNGDIIMVRGNHDSRTTYPGITVVEDTLVIDPNNENNYWLVMSHYPKSARDQFARNFAFCGHVHEKWRSWYTPEGRLIYNVGTDVWSYKPISLQDVLDDLANPTNRIVGEWNDPHES